MKALVIEGARQAAIRELPYPEPGKNEVTIEVKRVGICGTDIHIFEGDYLSAFPIVPGHEFSGVIHSVGEGVTDLRAGDRVSADPSLFCGACQFCLTNRGNHCERWGALGVTKNGSMAEYIAVPAANVVKLPDSMGFEEGAFIEPVACIVHAMNRLQLKVGSRVILFGAGAMGQQLIQALSVSGASEVVAVDISPDKLAMALENGATKAVLSDRLTEEIKADSQYEFGFDTVIDVTGIPAVIEIAMQYIGPVGTYLQFGVTPDNASIRINPFDLYHKDWTLLGSMAINHTFIPAFHWMKERRIQVKPLISKTISLEEAIRFFNEPKSPDLLKVQIEL